METETEKLDYTFTVLYYVVAIAVIFSILYAIKDGAENLLFCCLILIWLSVDEGFKNRRNVEYHHLRLIADEFLSLKRSIRETGISSNEESFSDTKIEHLVKEYKNQKWTSEKWGTIYGAFLVCAYGLTLIMLLYDVWPVILGPFLDSFIRALL